MKFQLEPLRKILVESEALTLAHSEEINLFGESLDMDYELYYSLCDEGHIRTYTARDDNGKLIGYCLFMIYYHLQHRKMLVAHQHALYIEPQYRSCGIKLLRYTEKELKELGVDIILQAAPKISRLGKVLERMGYEELETVYTRRL